MKGCLLRHKRAKGDCWVLRYRDGDVNRKEILGDVATMTRKQAQEKMTDIIGKMNAVAGVTIPRTVAELVMHYTANELPLKKPSTQEAYRIYFEKWIVPKWGTTLFRNIETMQFENWLKTIPRPNSTKSKIKNMASALYTHALRYKFCTTNPILLVRQSAAPEREVEVLTAEEIAAIRDQLQNPVKTVVHIAAVTGLRISELLALQWGDIDFEAQEILPTRTIIDGKIGGLKTEASGKAIPIDKALRSALLDWRCECPYNQNGDFLFGSTHENGTAPLWSDTMLHRHLKPAVKRAGISKRVSWHTFRHSYATLLVGSGANVKAAQDLLRHANAKTTMDVYAKSIPNARRAAQQKVAVSIFGSDSKMGNGSFRSLKSVSC